MFKQRYILIFSFLISISLFLYSSYIQGFHYFSPLDYNSTKIHLNSTYEEDYEQINTYIQNKLSDNLSYHEMGIYKVLQLHYALLNGDYHLILEKQSTLEKFLLHKDMFPELIHLYIISSIAHISTENYEPGYISLEKGTILISLVSPTSLTKDQLKIILTLNAYKTHFAQILGLTELSEYNLETLEDYKFLYEQKDYGTITPDYYKALFNYHYYENNYEEAILYGEMLINNTDYIDQQIPFYYTLLVRLAQCYSSTGDFHQANLIYQNLNTSYKKQNLTQYIEVLRLESDLLINDGNFDLASSKLLDALAISNNLNDPLLQLNVINDLISYYTQQDNTKEISRYTQLLTDVEGSFPGDELAEHMYQQIESEESILLQHHVNYLYDKQLKTYRLALIIVLSVGISFTTSILLLYRKHRHTKELNKQIIHFDEHLLDQLKYHLVITKHQESTRQLHHDLKNHYTILHSLMQQKNYEKMDSYLSELGSKVQELPHYRLAHHQILDSLLLSKQQLCQDKGIQFSGQVDFSQNSNITDIAIITIFSNIFDNAIEACDTITLPSIPKTINLVVKTQGNLIYITMTNTKQHKIVQKNNLLKTTKKDKENHGIGLASVKNSIKPYGGVLKFTYTETSFTINILLRQKV